MTLDELRRIVAASDEDDWNSMPCWGRSGPSLLPIAHYPDDDDDDWTDREHHHRASYHPDVAIGLAWGATSNPEFRAEWVDHFPHAPASSAIVDILYNGMLADRAYYVVVDEGRAYLPLPRPSDLTITQWQYDFFRVLDSLERLSEFDSYLQRAGIRVA